MVVTSQFPMMGCKKANSDDFRSANTALNWFENVTHLQNTKSIDLSKKLLIKDSKSAKQMKGRRIFLKYCDSKKSLINTQGGQLYK